MLKSNKIILRAGLLACFFFAATVKVVWATDSPPIKGTPIVDHDWHFDPELENIYRLAINLQTDQAQALLAKVHDKDRAIYKIYLESICETIDVLIGEDQSKYYTLEKNFKSRAKLLDDMPESGETLFLQAELALQRGFNLINLGQEISAVFALRSAYNYTQDCIKKYPNFIPIKKTSGLMQVMVGSVPDKYHWFISLLGMKGSVTVGQKQLDELRNSSVSLSLEATIIYYAVKGLINQQIDEASKGFSEKLKTDPNNRLVMFLAVNMMMKNSQSEDAYKLIQNLDVHNQGLTLPYIEYLRGEILMQKNQYEDAIIAYQKFIKIYKAQSFKKDANLKISICYNLLGKVQQAKDYWNKALEITKYKYDPDVSAAAMLADGPYPNEKILKTRLYTDGGYYKEARAMLQSITPADLKNYKQQVEYYYRKARLAHKTNDINGAKLFYQQTIDMTADNPWYYSANSSLQMGYIFQAAGDLKKARVYFEQALNFKRHEYKNSIDSKAKSALEQLPKGK